MVLRKSRLLLLVVLAAAWTVGVSSAEARHRTSPDLFYNYYVPPGPCCGGVGAELYLCPRPTPPLVGHTWYTYQPLLPHEYMYTHCRKYVRRNPGAGLTCTKVKYCHNPIQALMPPWMDGKLCGHIFVNPFAGYGKYYHP
ncbi:MAG: hypothetical protein JW719_12325 [Pirellulales bacterium]|nr:hypothetical protein [Pirellulales bacterium]